MLHGGLTEMNIDDLSEREYATIVAILSKRENVFSIRQVRIRIKKLVNPQVVVLGERDKSLSSCLIIIEIIDTEL